MDLRIEVLHTVFLLLSLAYFTKHNKVLKGLSRRQHVSEFPYFLKINRSIVLAVLGLQCFTSFALAAAEQGPLCRRGAAASHWGGFSCLERMLQVPQPSAADARGPRRCVSRALSTGSVVVVHRLSCSVALGFSWIRDRSLCLCIGSGFFTRSHQGTPCAT